MAAKTWEQDFRKEAVQASIRNLPPEHRGDPFHYDGSFCLPVREKPMAGWTPGRLGLITYVAGFTLLIGGVLILVQAIDMGGQVNPVLLVLAAFLAVLGVATFFIPVKNNQMILSRILGDRVRGRMLEFGRERCISCELSPPGGKKLMAIDGDDHVLIFFDDENCKLIIEGVGARYQIRGSDVEGIAAYLFMDHIGVHLTCRIDDDTTLDIALTRFSLIYELMRHIPILLLFKKLIRNPLLKKCERTLHFSETLDVADHEWEEVEAAE